MDRRDFLKAGVAGMTLSTVGNYVAESAGRKRRRVGLIGCGWYGKAAHLRLLQVEPAEVVCLCDVDSKMLAEAAEIVASRQASKKKPRTYTDYRQMLKQEQLDIVQVSTPDHWHALIAIYAAQAGKDIYCEKPLTLTIAEGRALVNAVRRYGRVFQTGSQQRSARNFRFACELVRSGRIGKLREIRVGIGGGPVSGWEPDTDPPPGLDWDMYLGPAPWVPFNRLRFLGTFRWFFDYSGGKMTDWGAHHNDIAQWGNGTELTGPTYIDGRGEFPKDGLFETAVNFTVRYEYEDAAPVICSNSNRHGITFIGTDGWVYVDRGKLEADPPDLLQERLVQYSFPIF